MSSLPFQCNGETKGSLSRAEDPAEFRKARVRIRGEVLDRAVCGWCWDAGRVDGGSGGCVDGFGSWCLRIGAVGAGGS